MGFMTTCTLMLRCQAFSSDLADGYCPWYTLMVFLLSWSASKLQFLLDSINHFCLGLGLVISPAKAEAVVSNGPGTASRQVGIRSFRSLPAANTLA